MGLSATPELLLRLVGDAGGGPSSDACFVEVSVDRGARHLEQCRCAAAQVLAWTVWKTSEND